MNEDVNNAKNGRGVKRAEKEYSSHFVLDKKGSDCRKNSTIKNIYGFVDKGISIQLFRHGIKIDKQINQDGVKEHSAHSQSHQ